tara:strand:- start:349 stop:894 length:546 start_codon:yes stop_codon:yes gene_type:complete
MRRVCAKWHGIYRKSYLIPSREVRISIRKAADRAYAAPRNAEGNRRRQGRDMLPAVRNDPSWRYRYRDGEPRVADLEGGCLHPQPYRFVKSSHRNGGFELWCPTTYDERFAPQHGTHTMTLELPSYLDTFCDLDVFEEHQEVTKEELKAACAARKARLAAAQEEEEEELMGAHGGINQRYI